MNDSGRSQLEDLVNENPTSEFARVLLDQFHHFVALGPRLHVGCGSYLINGQSHTYEPREFKKQEALFRIGKTSNSVLEIGVYLGHSLLILLIANPTLRITCIDNDASFSPAAVAYLNEHFGNRITFHLGTAEEVLARETSLGVFDCIHIDADHTEDAVARQFALTRLFAAPGATYVFDDYEAVRPLIDGWIESGFLHHVETPWCAWTNIITRLNNVSS